MFSIITIQLQISSLNSIQTNLLHLWVNNLTKTKPTFTNSPIHIPLKLIIRHLVTLLIFPVSLAIFLDGVVGEMDYFLADVVDVELVG